MISGRHKVDTCERGAVPDKGYSCKVANAGRWSVLKELPVHSDGHKVMIRHSPPCVTTHDKSPRPFSSYCKGLSTGCSEGLGTKWDRECKFGSDLPNSHAVSGHIILLYPLISLLLILTNFRTKFILLIGYVSLSAAEEEVCWLSVTQRTPATGCSSGYFQTYPQ